MLPKSARKWIIFSLAIQPLWSLPLAFLFGSKWLSDEDTSSVFDGPAAAGVNKSNALIFGAIGIISLLILLVVLFRWAKGDRRAKRLRDRGQRAPGVIRDISRTNTRINGRPLMRMTVEVRPPSGAPFAFDVKTLTPAPAGTQVTVAYDPSKPHKAVILDDLNVGFAQAQAARVAQAWANHPGAFGAGFGQAQTPFEPSPFGQQPQQPFANGQVPGAFGSFQERR